MPGAAPANRYDERDVAWCERIERRIALIRQAGEAAMIWGRVLVLCALPLSVLLGLPADALALARELIRSGS